MTRPLGRSDYGPRTGADNVETQVEGQVEGQVDGRFGGHADKHIDAYPTRSRAPQLADGRMPWIEREDPTLWDNGAADAPTEPRAEPGAEPGGYADNGFAIDRGLLSVAEVQDFWGELDTLLADSAHSDDPRIVREPGSGEVRSIFAVHEMSDKVAAIARDERVLDTARRILGSEVYIHQSRINHMPGFVGNGFYWHSDFETWHAEDGLPRPRAVSLSLALSDNYPFNGGLMLIPGSHRHFVPCGGDTPRDNHLTSLVAQESGVPGHDDVTELVAEYGIEQFTGSAGDALWFDSNVMHGSSNNITPYLRSNIFLVFNSVDNAPQEPFDGTGRRPEYIAATSTTPLR